MSGLHREFLELAAARIDGPLAPVEQERLDAHLAACAPCRERAAAYEADHLALGGLREAAPPRDLWARTAAALDHEQARPAGWRGLLGSAGGRRPAGRRASRNALAAVLVVLVGVALVGSSLFPGLGGPSGEPTTAQATPFAIRPSLLAYFSTRDGDVGVYMGRIDRVCPEAAARTTCQPIDTEVRKVASFASDFVPQRLAVSPDGRNGAVVGMSASGGAVYALQFPDLAEATPEPTVTASIETSTATLPGASGETPAATPTAVTPTTVPGGTPAAIIDHVTVVGEAPAYSADGTMLAFSAMPADGSSGPDIYVWHVGDAAAAPLTDDHGSIFASWAGAAVVGSRGGEPLDGAAGKAGAVTPASFLIDPASGEQRDLARSAWRPIVDPTGRFVIYWDGTLVPSADGLTWREERGGLYLAAWRLFDPAAVETPGPTPEPTAGSSTQPEGSPGPTFEPTAETPATAGPAATDTPAASAEPTRGPAASAEPTTPDESPSGSPGSPTETASPASSAPDEPIQLQAGRDYDTEPVLSWEVRWSRDGEWFGAWIGDATPAGPPPAGPEAGRLTVGSVDRATGRIDPLKTQLDGTPAVRGFDLGDHRIAWATLPGPDGASEVRLLAWTTDGRGLVRTTPGGASNTLPAL